MDLKIISLNVRGLRDDAKRREVFNWLRRKKQSIYVLQEVHCTENTKHLWSAELGYQAIFSSCKSNKAGVCLLFNNNLNLQIQKLHRDPLGRFIICDLKADGKCLTLANIYAPNDDNLSFFQNLFDHLLDFNCEDIIIGGDFNLVLDVAKDKEGGLAKTHQNSLKTVQEFSENLYLVDVWRVLNPDVDRFTQRQRQPKVQCRMDFFLVSQSILGNITLVDIVPGYKTDHSMITLNLSLHSNPRGPGFWKLNCNTSFLTGTAYINLVKSTIQETQDEYKEDDSVNPALLWDKMKLKYAAAKKKMVKQRETDLEQIISRLEKEIDNSTSDTQNSNLVEQLNEKRSELEKIIEFLTKGAILRSKIKWFKKKGEGEKNTKYFLSLEKRHYKQGTISQLKTNENDFITSDHKILSECKLFYTNLYTSKLNTHYSLHNTSDVFLNMKTTRC